MVELTNLEFFVIFFFACWGVFRFFKWIAYMDKKNGMR